MNRLKAVAFAILAFAALPAPSYAASAGGSALVPAPGNRLEVAVNQGQLVRLKKPVDSVFIADPAIADVQVKSPTLVYVIGKAAGATTLYAVTEDNEVVLNTQVQVHFDAGRVAEAIRGLVPRTVAVNAVADSLVLSGTVYSASDGEEINRIAARYVKDPKQLVNKMKVDAPNQVNLRVRIAEMSRDIVKEFGINWQSAFNNGNIAFGLLTAGQTLIDTTTASSINGKVVPLIPGSPTFGFNTQQQGLQGTGTLNNLFIGGRGKSFSINNLIDALDNHGMVTVLAEPNLTAISGQPANFLAGGEFPVPVPAGQGLVGIEWKKFGVSLNFVATIGNDNHISLHVTPEVSELSTQGAISIDNISVPSLTSRRAETTIELASGQAFAIAGLLQNNITQNINKFPWLGDIPILGQLFRSEAFQRNESELVIIVTPYIVHPIASASLAHAPTDGFVPSTDGQLVLHANEYQPHPPGAPASGGGASVIGPVGFELQ
jgi:pilus assembly protein CpaC